ncbi:uncharacterized protein [Diabrotica undecimpunctata]|uniref:uncharacterized protein n=1 Tax=Diabrotica undecimpunctata TaxID=50387 RepID=UPI003B63AE7A
MLPLITNLEAIVITTYCSNKLTICSIYIPPNHSLKEEELLDLIFQLPQPFILTGNFNAHNSMWGSQSTFGRGKVVENIINFTNSCLLNTGSNTHFNISSGSFSAIDLSISDPKSAPFLTWQSADDLFDSNHYPIIISNNCNGTASVKSYWRLNKGNWPEYSKAVDTLLLAHDHLIINDVDYLLTSITDTILSAAKTHIGKRSFSSNHKAVPWWNSSCEEAIRLSKKALNKYQKTEALKI